jgi:DNA-binding NtrC family response regulator
MNSPQKSPQNSPKILVVEDDASLRSALFRVFDRKGYQVITSQSKSEALLLSQSERAYDLALIDLRLPDGDGLELMQTLKAKSPGLQVIILTGHGTIQTAVEATHKGAFHFLTKPFNLEELLVISERAIQLKELVKENTQLKSNLQSRYGFENIIGQSDGISRVLDMIDRVAATDSTVMITGESGTGKELVAKAIHFNSERADKPFVAINCGAIPAELLESELFGHVKGAFTNAIKDRMGRFELADGGTIFFDEIGDMSPALQVKLLRLIQEKTFEPVGSTKTITADVRILAATNVNLENAVENGSFREDLFYRLNVIPIIIPSLRERKSDIPLLIHHFMVDHTKNGRGLKGVAPDAMEALYQYAWPGNIRELENLIERITILKGDGLIEMTDLPMKYKGTRVTVETADRLEIPENGVDFNTAVDSFENSLIMKALEKTGWNRNQAATLLRLNRTTLVEKIKKKGLRPPEASN